MLLSVVYAFAMTSVLQDERRQMYAKYLAILASVAPGVVLFFGSGATVLFVATDLIGVPWGWGILLGVFSMFVSLVAAVLLGMGIQRRVQPTSGGG